MIGESGLGTNRAEVLEADELPPFFIPQLQPGAFQTSPEGQARHLLKLGILPQALLETVVRDSAEQMMNVMHANVARDPVHPTPILPLSERVPISSHCTWLISRRLGWPSTPLFVREDLQRVTARRMLQSAQRRGFDLPDPLAAPGE